MAHETPHVNQQQPIPPGAPPPNPMPVPAGAPPPNPMPVAPGAPPPHPLPVAPGSPRPNLTPLEPGTHPPNAYGGENVNGSGPTAPNLSTHEATHVVQQGLPGARYAVPVVLPTPSSAQFVPLDDLASPPAAQVIPLEMPVDPSGSHSVAIDLLRAPARGQFVALDLLVPAGHPASPGSATFPVPQSERVDLAVLLGDDALLVGVPDPDDFTIRIDDLL